MCASIGAFVVGFRYRRRAGVGISSSRGGIRSSVNGTCGSIEIIDLVRKSSGVTMGAVRVENDLAADANTRKEAVRLDLKADLRGLSTSISSSCSGFVKALKSSSSNSMSGVNSG